jgi:hypothetical protein
MPRAKGPLWECCLPFSGFKNAICQSKRCERSEILVIIVSLAKFPGPIYGDARIAGRQLGLGIPYLLEHYVNVIG